ncbi:unnamed protein product [Bursaphelenchus okinawaensis]|uniref:AAA+ ATPase domain-containing protein n=1 Tax=Bursaphelenchus okinawaensis TaxID=465554 RepID=A0A811KQM8_9BILA|nr:unnamed protein product [Bursaphelenchus okinawaensis]CAG9108126.1 unnamed protein product [Bursaphelenchus okinawaensis]
MFQPVTAPFLATQLPSIRFSRHSSNKKSLNSVEIDAKKLADVYKSVFADANNKEVRKVLKDASRFFRRRNTILSVGAAVQGALGTQVLFDGGINIVGTRGFRTNAGRPKGIGQRKDDFEDDKGPLRKFFDNLRKDQNLKLDKSAEEQLKLYKDELSKVSDKDKRPYLEGFSQAILMSNKNQAQNVNAVPNKKFSLITRIYIAVVIAIMLAFLSGGERPIGSLIFSNAQEVKPEEVSVTFEDVRGMEEAKSEVEEIVSYLRDPDRYSRLGGRLPKGVLMVGPPGTGKTLLARAIAGEAQVPFFHTSGSEFDEVLVGQGARRVRDLFERAKTRAPCIIFIDEIDSVGSKRVSNSIHPYANQTINQLLSEMDGFNRNEGVIVIGATNRLEDLDKALLRPGRFDVRVTVAKPDVDGRKDIFRLYLGRIIHEKLNVDVLAKGTTGFTGADIENMVNQAALKAATEGCNRVSMRHLEDAKDRIIMGPARVKGRFPDEETNKCTAFHEAGHTLVALFTKDAVPVHKVTIIPRGQSMGHTALLPSKDEYQVTRAQMLAQLDVMMGGRVAEELIFGDDKVTTGAADDMKKATELATQMVKHYGMSDKVGIRDYTIEENTGALVNVNDRSPQTNELLDQEINRLLKESYTRAKKILTDKAKEHTLLAQSLLQYETLTSDEVRELIKTGKLDRPNLTNVTNNEMVPQKRKRRDKAPSIIHVNVDVD